MLVYLGLILRNPASGGIHAKGCEPVRLPGSHRFSTVVTQEGAVIGPTGDIELLDFPEHYVIYRTIES